MLSKVITISQQKGGTGKTTLAVHLAMAFIKYHNLKVAIIDTDPQGSLGKWFMIRTEKKVSNENLTFKTASLWGAQYESKTLKNDHDIVIIDTPPKIESDARPAIEAADLVLIPMAASHVDFWATGAIVEIAKKANKKILAQINRSSQRSKLIDKTKDFIKSLDLNSTDTIIGSRQIY
ncbi:MAG: ParA family protein, partial [Flavobacteriaceae bacterium]|nr:ParA family protein [Flavobacteriaceae bacterium]